MAKMSRMKRSGIFRWLIPRIALADFPHLMLITCLGAVAAGAYGILHDQWTYSISPEYFVKLKFKQFHYADFGWGPRVFAGTIGFLASWWVGSIIAWFIGRRFVPGRSRQPAYRSTFKAFGIVFCCGALGSFLGFLIGLAFGPEADYSNWNEVFVHLGIIDRYSFVRVAYIHNASYLGGLAGLVAALLFVRPPESSDDSRK